MTDEHNGPCGKYCAVVDECQARGARIDELERMLAVHRLAVDVDALKARIAALEAALKGCIKTIEDYKIDGPSLRAARAAYLGEKDG